MGIHFVISKKRHSLFMIVITAPRIIHLGFGAFHRAHQGRVCRYSCYRTFSVTGDIMRVNLIGGEQQIADLQQQDNLYTVAEMSADAWTARVVGVVKKSLAHTDGWLRNRVGCDV
ncbi:hypothetical protein ACP0HM_06185 [Escherichia coli]